MGFVPQSAALQSLADPHRVQQIDGALLEHAGPDAVHHILAIAVFDDHRVDAVEMKQVPEHQAGRTGTDDSNLSREARQRSVT